jgi:general stress protein YciG
MRRRRCYPATPRIDAATEVTAVTDKEMTVREAGRKGGETTKKRYGPRFYEEIGKKGGQKVKRMIEDSKRIRKQLDESKRKSK